MESLTQQFENALAHSPFLAFILVYIAGILTSLTPCVLPLFPVAVGTITATARRREFLDGKMVETVTHRGRAFLMGMVYALGLASMFVILGMAAALSGKAVFGALASSPIAYLVLALVMILLALWLWKGDRVDIGAWLQNRSFAKGDQAGLMGRAVRWYSTTQGGGAAATFAFGFISGLLAGPCTAPVIALVLTHVAKAGALFYGSALMFVYALGLATLMVVAGMSASLASRLRSQGRLGQLVKLLFLLVIVVMAGYYLYQAATFGGWFDSTELSSQANSTKTELWTVTHVDKSGLSGVKALEKGALFPDFSYREQTPQTANSPSLPLKKLSQLRGKVVYLPFWGIWCKECVAEIPAIKQFVEIYKDNPQVTVLSVDVLDTPNRMRAFAAEKELTYPIVMDLNETLTEHLGMVSFPQNVILAPDGTVAYSGSAFPKDHANLIQTLLKSRNTREMHDGP